MHYLRPALLLLTGMLLCSRPIQAQIPEHGLALEIWGGIGGVSIADLTSDPRYPSQPDSTTYVTDLFEAPTDALDFYGERLHGYVVPPVSGSYTFWISSDDAGSLFLSNDEDPSNGREIAYVTGWTSPREWTREPNQQSAPVSLVAGKAYYVSALMKEGSGGDNLAVRWLRPDGADEGPIPAAHLIPFGTSFAAPVIARNPTNTTAVEGGTARFTVALTAFGVYTYEWQRNGLTIPGATGPELVYSPVRTTDNNARFRCVVSNAKGSSTSADAILTVQPDTTRPQLVRALNLGRTTVQVIFSEPLLASSVTAAANYVLNNGANVISAAVGSSPDVVLLTTSLLTIGTTYQLSVSGVQDQAAAPNTILPGSQVPFLAADFSPYDIGTPPVTGDSIPTPSGVNVIGSGDFGQSSDSFQFAWQQRTGDFDVRARLDSFSPTDPFAKAGLMARENLNTGSRFVAALATPATVGCFSLVRSTANTPAASTGYFPANYPNTWLRLKRAGNAFTVFAGYDGQSWVQLGSTSMVLPGTIYFGLAVSSRNAGSAATVQFRDIGTVSGSTTGTFTARAERLGPSTRLTPLVISEIMYHPKERADGLAGEFIEVYNADLIPRDLTGHRIAGSVEYAFPDGYVLPAGGFAVIARNPAEFAQIYGGISALGPFSGPDGLPNNAGLVQLRNPQGAVFLETEYASQTPWPAAADGSGHSLVLANPSYGEGDPRAWAPSARIGGSPGQMESIQPDALDNVLINEILAHTDEPQIDYLELFNRSTSTINLSGCVLTDDPTTNRFRIPNGTTIPPRGLLAFNQNQLGFRLDAAGESLFLIHSNLTRVLDAVRFGPQENGIASGRYPDGSPAFRPLSNPTPGAENEMFRISPVVINEIMYHPISEDSDDEFIELHNRSTTPVDLSGWSISDGIDFRFPQGATLAAGGYAVVARDPARMLTNYPGLSAAVVFGPSQGSLANGGERLALARPGTILSTNTSGIMVTNLVDFEVDEVTYGQDGRWGKWSDGLGSSLELIDPNSDHLQPSNWADSDETAKAPWGTIEVTGRLDNGDGNSANRLQIMMQGPGECLVDNIEVIPSTGGNRVANPTFDVGLAGWTIQGNHRLSSHQTTGGYSSGCLHVRATGRGDTAVNRIFTTINPALANNSTATLRARVRWLRGWPEFMLRTRGNYLEAAGRMALPTNLGTPGARNSQAIANAGPAIFDVQHAPILPANNQSVLVTARLTDPDRIGSVTLRYRPDPGTTTTSLTMKDDGTGGDALAGDGVFSGTIPGRSSGSMVAFYIQAADAPSSGATTTRFPADAPIRECLVRWGETQPLGNLGVYRLWQRQSDYDWLRTREPLANDNLHATFVYNDTRVIYNMEMRGKGSPWHGGSVGTDYIFAFPDDDPFLGAGDVALVTVGNLGNDDTAQREAAAFWIGSQMGIPTLNRRHVFFFENGARKQQVYEDTEEPNGLYADRWWPDGPDGDLYKVEDWFEFDDSGRSFTFSRDATLQPFTTVGGAYKLPRYRWSWRKRAVVHSANDYTSLFDLVTAINQAGQEQITRLQNLVDMENWMGIFALQHIVGNWDAYGYDRGKNAYIYKPVNGRFGMVPWDIDFVLGSGSDSATTDIFGANDPTITRLWDVAPFRRMYLQAFLRAVDGPLQNSRFDPLVDGRYAALTANGVAVAGPQTTKSWVTQRRNFLANRIAGMDTSSFAITSNNGADFSTSQSLITLTGTAPLRVETLTFNGASLPLNWTTATGWSVQLALGSLSNRIEIVGLDSRGNPLPGASDSITIQYTGTLPTPMDQVIINEIMYNPAQPEASFVEVYNTSATAAFDLAGWRLDGVDFTFPAGTILAPGAYAVVASSVDGFAAAYGFSVLPVGQYLGRLQNNGERLRLVRPGASPELDLLVDEVRYDNDAPWPTAADGGGPSLQLIDPRQDNWRVGNWMAASATPGRANSGSANLPAFPALFLNEVQPQNTSGLQDRMGDRDPWVELYNGSDAVIDLSGWYLSADLSQLNAWTFPDGTRLGPRQWMVVWADSEPGESTASELHTSFRLPGTNGTIALSRLQLGAPAVMDYLEYENQPDGLAFGAFPDGRLQDRSLFHLATPGTTNTLAAPSILVSINEWMANNSGSFLDPADSDPDDWFELYNAGKTPANLSAYSLTDDPATPSKFVIPNNTVVPAGGFLLVWADEETSQTIPSQLHADFKLSNSGESITLVAPDGGVVDQVVFGAQSSDVAQGRFPDGMTEPFVFMDFPTPAQPNQFATANQPPVLAAIGSRSVTEGQVVEFTAMATDPDAGQALTYSLFGAPDGATINAASGAFTWTTTEADGPGQYSFSVRATDNGTPARWDTETITVTVAELNQAPVLDPVPDTSVDEGSPLFFTAVAHDPDLPPQRLQFTLDEGAPVGATMNETTGEFSWTPSEAEGPGTYPITLRVTDEAEPAGTSTRTFTVRVNEVDNPPVFTPVGLQTVDEQQLFSLTVVAQDPDTPPKALAYSILSGPSGLQIHPTSGLVSWTPMELQGPNSYSVQVEAREVDGMQFALLTFSIVVNESNLPPVLEALPDLLAAEGETISFSCGATDPDLPAQKLTFSLGPSAPTGATIDPDTGRFTWAIGTDAGPSTNVISVRVVDDGVQPRIATRSFRIVVVASPRIVINEIMHRPATSGAEFVELHNTSTNTSWDLSGWWLTGARYTFPANTMIPPNGFLVVARNLPVFNSNYPGIAALGNYESELSADGGTVVLWRPSVGDGPDQVIDWVSFTARAPWPALANGGGASLQLIDPRQDNTRIGNWAAGTGSSNETPAPVVAMDQTWRYWQATVDPLPGWANRTYDDSLWLSGPALLYVENAALPAPKNTALSLGAMSFLFRTHFTFKGNPEGAIVRLSTIIDDGAVFYLNGVPFFWLGMENGVIPQRDTPANRTVADAILEGPFDVPVTNLLSGDNVLAVQVHQINPGSTDVVFGMEAGVLEVRREMYTPGRANSVRATLEPFPPVFLNEVLVANTTGITDGNNEREPWIELANFGDSTVQLDGYTLSADAANLRQWSFPAGASLAATAYKVVWADGESAETAGQEWHTSFRPSSPSGMVLLSRLHNGSPSVVDYVEYTGLAANQSFGFQVADRFGASPTVLAQPTPGSANNSVPAPAPTILPVALGSTGEIIISWSAVAGRTYRLECKNDLQQPSWQDLGQTTATAATASLADTFAAGQPHRFYRVVLLP